MKALAFGEILWDVFPEKQVIGGAPFNFAAHFVKNGGQAYLASAVGNDTLGDKTLKEVKKSGVKTNFVYINEKETGRCVVTLDEDCLPTYNLLDDVAYDYIDTKEAVKENFDILYFGTLSLRAKHNFDEINILIEKGSFKEIFVDVNIRAPFSTAENVVFAVSKATILKISDEELPFVTKSVFSEELDFEKAAERLSEKYPHIKVIIITLGAKGSYAYDCTLKKGFRKYGKKVEAVSTVGAGDSYSAAFMYSYMTTRDLFASLEMAAKVSAFVVTKTEAVPEYDPEEIRIMAMESLRFDNSDGGSMKISRLFSNGMIIQAGKEIRIFGTGKGKAVAEINGVKGETVSDNDKWLITLPAQNYGGPYTLKVSLNGNVKEFNDVWFGDVYLVAGQSNIRYYMRLTNVKPEEYEENSSLRIFGTNEEDISGFSFDEGWCTLKKENVPRWSAVAYYMGLDLVKKSEHKVGIIICTQGAGVLQAFLPKGYLDDTDCYIPFEERSFGARNPEYTWNRDGFLYEEKFSKMIPYNVKLAVWYQGESNTNGKDPFIYDKLLVKFVEKWRFDLKDNNLPFIIVQLANYKNCGREGWSTVQDMQEKAARNIKNAYLVKCSDICEDNDIHPPTKNLLGVRLADKIREIS